MVDGGTQEAGAAAVDDAEGGNGTERGVVEVFFEDWAGFPPGDAAKGDLLGVVNIL